MSQKSNSIGGSQRPKTSMPRRSCTQQAEENQKGLLLDQLLDAQTRLADSETQYVRSLIEYMMAIKQIHNAKGSLLNYNQVYVSEGAWPLKAQQEAAERASRRI